MESIGHRGKISRFIRLAKIGSFWDFCQIFRTPLGNCRETRAKVSSCYLAALGSYGFLSDRAKVLPQRQTLLFLFVFATICD